MNNYQNSSIKQQTIRLYIRYNWFLYLKNLKWWSILLLFRMSLIIFYSIFTILQYLFAQFGITEKIVAMMKNYHAALPNSSKVKWLIFFIFFHFVVWTFSTFLLNEKYCLEEKKGVIHSSYHKIRLCYCNASRTWLHAGKIPKFCSRQFRLL